MAEALSLSVVIPVYNESRNIADTLRTAAAAVAQSPFSAEFVVVDDGSTDGTGQTAVDAACGVPVRVLTQPNGGRLAARRAGLAAATGRYLLFLDSRVQLAPRSLSFVAERVSRGHHVWNGHVVIDTHRNPFGKFWNVLTELAFGAYFDNPTTTSFGLDDFDAFPKGTTCFLAPTELLRKAFGQVRTRYRDERNANDDTPIIRWIAGRERIHISPYFSCLYQPRASVRGFVQHAFHRGIVFLDGHGRRESRFFPAVIVFYPASVIALALAVKRPLGGAVLLAVTAAATGAFAAAKRRDRSDIAAFAALTPVYGAAHGAGMWLGLALAVVNRLLPQGDGLDDR